MTDTLLDMEIVSEKENVQSKWVTVNAAPKNKSFSAYSSFVDNF